MDQTLSRRSGLITGAKLAFAAPAVVAALRAGVASADTGAQNQSDANSPSPSPAQMEGLEGLVGVQRLLQVELCPTSGNMGSALVQVLSANGSTTPTAVIVSIAGAATGATYNLVFTPSGGSATTILNNNLGATSNPGGNFSSFFTSFANALPADLNALTSGMLTITNSSGTAVFTPCTTTAQQNSPDQGRGNGHGNNGHGNNGHGNNGHGNNGRGHHHS